MITTRVPAYRPPDPPPPPTPHDPDALPGACPACGPYDDSRPIRPFLIMAGRGGGMSLCGHWHAEHAVENIDDAYRLTDELVTRHATVEMSRMNDDGRYHLSGSRTRGERPDAAPCCQPIAAGVRLDYRTQTNRAGARCPYCGDLMARWTAEA